MARLKRSRDLDQILDDCLERLATGATVEDCVARYPEDRDELAPLLQVAAATTETASSLSYRPEAKARGLNRLTTAAARRGAPRTRRFAWLRFPTLVPRPVASGLAVAVVATGAVVGTGMASSNSVPGDPLYPVKTIREEISLMMPKSDMSLAQEHVHLASVRGQEMLKLTDRGKFDEAEVLMDRMTRHLNDSAGMVGIMISTNPMEMPHRPMDPFHRQGAVELVALLQRDGDILKVFFQSHLPLMPPEDQPRIQHLMHRSELNYRVMITALQGGGPPRWSFWMTEPQRPRGR